MAKPRLWGFHGVECVERPEGSRIEELGSGMINGKLRHANKSSYELQSSRVSVTSYPPTGPKPAAKLPVGASSPLLHGMIRPQQRSSLRPIYFIYPHEGDPSYFPSRWALSTLPSGPAVFCVVIFPFPFDCWTTLHSFSAAPSRDDGKPPLLLDLAIRERQAIPSYLAS